MKNQLLIATLILISGALLSGCGSNRFDPGPASGSSDLASNSVAAAKCSHDVDNRSDLSIRAQLFVDSSGERSDMIRIKFDRFPETFSKNDSAAIQLWTRSVDAAGNWGDWRKVGFYVEKYSSGSVLRAPYQYTDITWAQLKQLGTYLGVSTESGPKFFGSVTLVAQLTDANAAKVLSAKIYDGTYSPETKLLLPIFQANPNEYAKSHAAILQALHPLQAYRSNGYTESQYQNAINQYCF